MRFGDLIRRNGRRWAAKDAFIDERRRLSWGAYHARTDAAGHALRRLGVAPGDRVAILSSDCVEVAETFGACMKVGAVRVGLNPRLAPPELAGIGCRLRTRRAVRPRKSRIFGGRPRQAGDRAAGAPHPGRSLRRPCQRIRGAAARRGGRTGADPVTARCRHDRLHDRIDRAPEGRGVRPREARGLHPLHRALRRD